MLYKILLAYFRTIDILNLHQTATKMHLFSSILNQKSFIDGVEPLEGYLSMAKA